MDARSSANRLGSKAFAYAYERQSRSGVQIEVMPLAGTLQFTISFVKHGLSASSFRVPFWIGTLAEIEKWEGDPQTLRAALALLEAGGYSSPKGEL